MFCKLMLQKPNVLVLDEPTNHLDLESIEALVRGLKAYMGTLVLVSHDRWFVGQLATRVLEITPDGIRDYHGTYEDYVRACGDDHLDVDQVVLKARKEKKRDRSKSSSTSGERTKYPSRNGDPRKRKKKLQERYDQLTTRVANAESRIEEIDAMFCQPDSYQQTPAQQVRALEEERNILQTELTNLMAEWEQTVEAIGELE